jgi:hypothetical protein
MAVHRLSPEAARLESKRIKTWLLKTHTAFKTAGHGQLAIDNLERQRRKLPWRRSADDPRRIARIELRFVARALKTL